MNDCTTDLILDELRALRSEFNTYARETGERLTATETDLHGLMGNGQPGRVSLLETSVSRLHEWRWQVVGAAAGGSAVVSVIGWLVMAKK